MILTNKAIRAGASNAGGWSAKQLALLEVSWPPRRGWLNKLVGKESPDEHYEQFLALRGIKKNSPKIPATDKQKGFIKGLLRETGYSRPVDWVESLSKGDAGKLIGELLEKKSTPPPTTQAYLPLPEPEPQGELGEFKRWARGAYQRGEKTILELIDLQRERFGNPFAA